MEPHTVSRPKARLADAHRAACLESIWSPFKICEAARDTDGRPIGELGSSIASTLAVPFQLKSCPYGDGRYGKPMNVSALRQMTLHWPELLRATAYLRRAYLRRAGCTSVTTWHLWRMTRFITALAPFLMRRAREPVADGALSTTLCSLLKVAQGLHITAATMLHRDLGQLDERIDPEAFIRFTDETDAYMHPSGRACSAPPHMIAEAVALMVDGSDAVRPGGEVEPMLGDLEAAFAYGEAGLALTLAKELVHVRHRRLALELQRTDPPLLARLAAMDPGTPGIWSWPYDPAADPAAVARDEARVTLLLEREHASLPDARPVDAQWSEEIARRLRDAPTAQRSDASAEWARRLIPTLQQSVALGTDFIALADARQQRADAALGRTSAYRVDRAVWSFSFPYAIENLFAGLAGFEVEVEGAG